MYMKKILSSVLALSFMAGMTMPALAETSATSTDQTLTLTIKLREGMTGAQVKLLQTILSADFEIYPEGLITGFFGKATAKAVKKFQKKYNLKQVGNVGPKTREKVNEFLKKNPVIEQVATSTPNGSTATSIDNREKRLCAIVPPGHLIAPGWLRKNLMPFIPPCQVIPPGIAKKFGIATTTPPTPPIIDTTAPIISSVAATSTTATTSTITWTTNEQSTSKVYYSTTTPISFATASAVSNNTLATAHSINLSGLTATTAYYYAVESKDIANNVATSTTYSFTTFP